jgi:hypothetical protein
MADRSHEQADLELDAVLAKYAAVVPRAGLEERVLANLRAQPTAAPGLGWWRWSVAAALAAVLVAALVVGWRSGKSSPPRIVNHPSTPAPGAKDPRTKVATNGGAKQIRPPVQSKQGTTNRRPQPTVVATVNPKLEQFPSPQPLSEQEQILATYVAQFHKQALMIARVTNEELQRDRAELIDKPQIPTGPAGRGDQETTNR